MTLPFAASKNSKQPKRAAMQMITNAFGVAMSLKLAVANVGRP